MPVPHDDIGGRLLGGIGGAAHEAAYCSRRILCPRRGSHRNRHEYRYFTEEHRLLNYHAKGFDLIELHLTHHEETQVYRGTISLSATEGSTTTSPSLQFKWYRSGFFVCSLGFHKQSIGTHVVHIQTLDFLCWKCAVDCLDTKRKSLGFRLHVLLYNA